MKKSFDDYLGVRRPRKVKHVEIFLNDSPFRLRDQINQFADDNPYYKILGVKISPYDDPEGYYSLMAVVTFLEDSKETVFGDYEDDADEERDSD